VERSTNNSLIFLSWFANTYGRPDVRKSVQLFTELVLPHINQNGIEEEGLLLQAHPDYQLEGVPGMTMS
jgi:hypothetical protein